MKMAIFFTFRWPSIYLRTLTISNFTHHHHPLHPQFRCHHRHNRLVDSQIHHHHRNSCRGPCIAALLYGTDSDSNIVPLYICTSQAVLKPRKQERVVIIGIHSSFSIVQSYHHDDGKAGLGAQSLVQTINWQRARSMVR